MLVGLAVHCFGKEGKVMLFRDQKHLAKLLGEEQNGKEKIGE